VKRTDEVGVVGETTIMRDEDGSLFPLKQRGFWTHHFPRSSTRLFPFPGRDGMALSFWANYGEQLSLIRHCADRVREVAGALTGNASYPRASASG